MSSTMPPLEPMEKPVLHTHASGSLHEKKSGSKKPMSYPTLRKLNMQLENKYPMLSQLEQTTGIPKHYILIIAVCAFLLAIFWGVGYSILISFMGFLYPVYRSFKALKSGSDLARVRYWIKFWIIWMMFSTMECFSDTAFSWVPFYYLGKFVFLMWCFLPQFEGADFLYEYLLRPFLVSNEDVIDDSMKEMTNAVRLGATHIGSKVRDHSVAYSAQARDHIQRKGKDLVRWSQDFVNDAKATVSVDENGIDTRLVESAKSHRGASFIPENIMEEDDDGMLLVRMPSLDDKDNDSVLRRRKHSVSDEPTKEKK